MFDLVRRRFLLVSSPTQVTISGSISTRVVLVASDPGSVCVPASNLRLYDGISYLQVLIKIYTHVFRVISPLRYTGTELENAPFRPDNIQTQRRRGGEEVLCIVHSDEHEYCPIRSTRDRYSHVTSTRAHEYSCLNIRETMSLHFRTARVLEYSW